VFGFEAESLIASAPASVIAVKNPDYELGMLTSLQAGLRAMPTPPARVLFTLVDHPAIESATVFTLLQTDALIAMPRFAGKRGHPVMIGREIAEEILAEPVTSRLNHVLDRHAGEIQYLDVDDPGVRDDIDDPQLYSDLLAREGVRV
jgi:molybdenum cofactor cytidylyltransferase